jgi:UDP-N-acetylmuramoyl-tripeptide--D-alanyl-D-alanine ligase
MKIEQLYQLYSQFFLVDTDTRKIRKNTIFFALKGENFNGNTFAENALKKGAIYAVVDEVEFATSENIILVKNTLQTLQELANYHRNQLKIPFIALTGSNGKTTTKELIACVLQKKYNVAATKGNFNNHIGVPLTLLSITRETEIAVIEMGANHQKEIAFLSAIAEPDYGYITNFGKAHLEGFGGIKGVIKGKSELYDYLRINNKTVFVNPNDTIQIEKSKGIKTVSFSDNIKFFEANPFVKISIKNTIISSNLIGDYNYTNIAVAITIGNYFKIKNTDIKEAIEHYIPNNNRSQIIKTKYNEIILDAYNANPSSMEVALKNFSKINSTSKTVILGDMFELGEESQREHQKIADLTASLQFDTIIFVGNLFNDVHTNKHKFKNFGDLEKHLKKNPLENQYILIKGSRGMQLERCIQLIN